MKLKAYPGIITLQNGGDRANKRTNPPRENRVYIVPSQVRLVLKPDGFHPSGVVF
jgi:hypothetical protein